jgi:hypothetical protein
MDMRSPEPRTIMFLDLETNNHEYYGAIASPRHPENFVVMNGHAVESTPYAGAVEYEHYPHKENVPANWLSIPDSVWLLVMHNAPYEMDWFLFLQRPAILAYLQRGGRIYCTAYGQYLISHQLETYPALDEVAPQYGGTHKVDGIKILWNQGVKTKDIDPALLAEYLAGPEGDVVNTRLVFYGQYQKLVDAGMWGMALERMEGLLFNVLAMDSGLFVDREVAFTQLAAQEVELKRLTDSFAQYRSHIPEICQFNTGSDWHMSAWLFGGPIKYVGRELATTPEGVQKWVKGDFVKLTNGSELLIQLNADGLIELADSPTGPVRAVSPEVYDFDYAPLLRYKSGKNKGQIKITREDTAEPMMRNCDMLQFLGPLVDLNMLPANILKEFKREFGGKRTHADHTDAKPSLVFSTGKDCLDMLALRPEFSEGVRKVLKDLQAFAKIDKDISTYYLRNEYDDAGNIKKQSGMLKYMNEKDIVHHSLNATATITSRLSSNNPNLQNIPRGNTSDVKKMFRSRFNDRTWLAHAVASGQITQVLYDRCIADLNLGLVNGFVVEADYSALEVVTMCAFTKDKALTKALLEGIDMHCMRLASQLGEPYEDVLLKAKDQAHPEFKRYDELRTDIKPKAFSYQYGATAQGIAFSTGCTVEEAQLFIDTEKGLFPEVEAWFEENGPVVSMVNNTSVLHREQTDSGGWQMYKRGYWQSPGGTCYSFRQQPKVEYVANGTGRKQRVELMAFKMTQVRNYPIQGESGFFVQGIGGRIARWLINNGFLGGMVYIINTVHDAYYFDCHKDVLDALCAKVKEIMESLPQYFNEKFGYDLHVPFPAAVEFGRSMHEKIHWHPGVLNDPKVREKLGWEQLKEAA